MLRVGVIGYSRKIVDHCVIQLLIQMEMENKNKVVTKGQHRFIFEDGTNYIILDTINRMRGLELDQIIIVDDNRWGIYTKQFEVISYAKYLMQQSCVPEEYKVIELILPDLYVGMTPLQRLTEGW